MSVGGTRWRGRGRGRGYLEGKGRTVERLSGKGSEKIGGVLILPISFLGNSFYQRTSLLGERAIRTPNSAGFFTSTLLP